MASEIEEPFTLDFRVDSFDSGSISFGRFESEVLCWERRSSFLHNRYLEEVEKCSTPGSVTEKKAYFEAHFRRKRFPDLTSPESPDDKFSKTEISDEEEIYHTNASAKFEETLDEQDNTKVLTECETRVDKEDDAELGTTLAINFESENQMKENLDSEKAPNIAIGPFTDEGVSTAPRQTSLPKKNITSKPDHIKPRLVPRASPVPSRKLSPSSTTSKGSVNKANDKVPNDRIRPKAENKTSGDPHKHRLLHKPTKYEGGSEVKGVDKKISGERQVRSRNRTIVEPQRPMPQTTKRVKPAVGVSKPSTRQDIPKSIRKEAVPSNIPARKQNTGLSIPGTRLSKSSQSGIDQTTSTVATSSSARSSKVKASQAAIGRKKEAGKEKLTSLAEGKKTTSYASFNRAGRMEVGVLS